MNEQAQRALQVETEFLAGVEVNLDRARGDQLRGSIWQTARNDEDAAVRAMLVRSRKQGDWRALLKQMPLNRTFALQGFERRWWLTKRRTGVAIATVLAPLEHLAAGSADPMPAVSLGELRSHLNKLVGDAKVPHVIGVCSPSGFTEEVRNTDLGTQNLTLVLIEPAADGGWKVGSGDKDLSPKVLELFDPEDAAQKTARIRKEIERRGADLLVGGVAASSVAGRVGLPEHLVRRAMEQVSAEDPELRISRQANQMLLYRGAPTARQEKTSMNVVDRIRSLFAKDGDEQQKVNMLAERRAGLAQRRDRIYEDIGKLEEKEAAMLDQGRQATSSVVKRRLASQLAQLRKDIARQNTTANMLNSQINILSTDIHNLTLIQQGQMAQLPDTEELTENAVKAEEMLETLKSDADLVSSLETGMGEVMTSDEELAILQEFEASETQAEPAGKASAAPAAPERTTPEPSEPASRGRLAESEPPEPPEPPQRRQADPEVT